MSDKQKTRQGRERETKKARTGGNTNREGENRNKRKIAERERGASRAQ